jgi:hypothetical protein
LQNGYGFVHFPLTTEGIQAAVDATHNVHQVTVDRITYDCTLSRLLEDFDLPAPQILPNFPPKRANPVNFFVPATPEQANDQPQQQQQQQQQQYGFHPSLYQQHYHPSSSFVASPLSYSTTHSSSPYDSIHNLPSSASSPLVYSSSPHPTSPFVSHHLQFPFENNNNFPSGHQQPQHQLQFTQNPGRGHFSPAVFLPENGNQHHPRSNAEHLRSATNSKNFQARNNSQSTFSSHQDKPFATANMVPSYPFSPPPAVGQYNNSLPRQVLNHDYYLHNLHLPRHHTNYTSNTNNNNGNNNNNYDAHHHFPPRPPPPQPHHINGRNGNSSFDHSEAFLRNSLETTVASHHHQPGSTDKFQFHPQAHLKHYQNTTNTHHHNSNITHGKSSPFLLSENWK